MAVTAAVTWTAAVQLGTLREEDALAGQVIAGHARALLTDHLTDVVSSDQHTVKPWLSAKLDFSPAVIDLTTEGYPLAGGRRDYLDGRVVAALVYRHRLHVIDLYVWPEERTAWDDAPRELSRHGYNVLHWSRGGMTYWAVSDLNREELEAFRDTYVRRTANG